ncbi:hypothetical protein D3C87_1390320 [compost metagenome]
MNDLVDIAGLCRQKQNAENRPEALDRNRDGNDQFAALGNAHQRAANTGQRIHHFRIDRAIAARRFLVDRQVARLEQPVEHARHPLAPGLRLVLDRWQIVAKNLSAGIEMPRIE